jgi:hypothetical protein
MLTRSSSWQSSLSQYLVACARQPFRYGVMDCGLFIAGAISAMTGLDVAAPLRGTYTNRREAFAAIKALCGKPTMEAIAEYLANAHGIPEVPVLCAQRGDPVLLRHGRTSSLGVIAMHGTEILTPCKDGLFRLPLSHATRAWHI